MNSLISLPIVLASFNIFNLSIAACAVVLAIAVILAILKYVFRVSITYIDPSDESVISVEKYFWLAKAPIYPATCEGKIFVGWSETEGDNKVIEKKRMLLTKSVKLYAVWAPADSVSTNVAVGGYDKSLTINLHYDPSEDEDLVGWGVKNDPKTTVDEEKIVVDVDLYAVFKKSDDVEEPAEKEPEFKVTVNTDVPEEDVVEEEVTEEVAEEPVAEETVEEVAEEPVVEEEIVVEPVEEPLEDETVEKEPVAEEETMAEAVEELAAEVADKVTEIVSAYTGSTSYNNLDIRYSRSFTANLIQGADVLREYYSDIKNYILSYKGVKSRISWKYDSYNRGRDQLFKIKLRGKTVCLYCALNPDDFDVSKYHHEAVDAKIFVDVPMLIKIKSNLGLRKAKEIVDAVMARFGIEKNEKPKVVDYIAKYPYQTNEELLAQNLIKELGSSNSPIKTNVEETVAEEAVEEVIEEPVAEEAVEEVVEEPVAEEAVEEVVEEPVAEEAVEEVVEEPVAEEAVEEVVEEPVAEEAVEEVVEEPVAEEAVEEVVEEPVAEETVEEVIEEPIVETTEDEQSTIEDANKEVFNESVVEETVDEVSEEPVVGETVEEVSEETVEEPVAEEKVEDVVEEPVEDVGVSAEEADTLIADNEIEEVGEDVEFISKDDTKKEIINIDTISNSFEAGDIVCLETLKKKKLINKKTKSIKVLARGRINKPLTIKAGDFSKVALKMIMLTGGTAIHSNYKVK